MIRPHRITQASAARAKSARPALFSVLRALVVLLALQLSGVGHALADLRLITDDATTERHGDCSTEEPGRDCPPGCPTCHHANGGVGSLPIQTGFVVIPAPPEVLHFSPEEADAPLSPELPSVFRPPKRA